MTTNHCRAQHPASNHERGARIVECGLQAGHAGWHMEAGTDVSWPAAPATATWVETDPEPTELTVEQKIRTDALHEAVSIGFQLDGHDDPIDSALAVAKRFEAYIRDGAK